MNFGTHSFTQGELAQTSLRVESSEGIDLRQFKGQTFGKTVYFYDVEPTGTGQAEAKVIFVKVPEAPEIQDALGTEQVVLHWGSISVKSTEGAKTLLFGTFEVPEKSEWIIWVVIGLLLTLSLGLGGWVIYKKRKQKLLEKQRILTLKDEVLGCRNYEDIVALWKRKHLLIRQFSHIGEPFLKMEETLNRHQFKPKQSEAEKIEVVEAYRKFTRSVEGGFSGI
ncbi:MAG TPA: hypothetical protein VNJ08_03495 [Bacteriovoracaceae bacterium]|nr:hypothetical protein [Bacteriovoracaceae bacterium]